METTGDVTPEQLLAEEASLALPARSDDDAVGIGLLALAFARSRALPVTLEVRRAAQVAFRAALRWPRPTRTPGSPARRASSSASAQHAVRAGARRGRTTFPERTGLPESRYAAHGGGVPRGRRTGMVGVLLVSGLPQVDDHALAVEVLVRLARRRPRPA
jgi:uncharacterized protein (UPF0303 family)